MQPAMGAHGLAARLCGTSDSVQLCWSSRVAGSPCLPTTRPSRLLLLRRNPNGIVVSAQLADDHNPLFLPSQAASSAAEAAGDSVARKNMKATKVTVVGVGNVGMACAQTILTQELAEELALVDVDPAKLRGEMLDLQHSSAFLQRAKISASTDYEITGGSDVCIITAGARQREGETRVELVERNAAVFAKIVPELVRHSPNTVLLVVSNPVDVLTWVSWKLAGGVIPSSRVIGSGTNLDSSRLRFLLAEHLGANAQDVQGYVLGEHGDSSVPVWSGVTVGGVPAVRFISSEKNREEQQRVLDGIHKAVVESAYEVIRLKGYTSWAIGYSTASLVRNIVREQRRINPVSVLAKGFHGIEEEVYLSLPVQLGRAGVVSVVNSPLSDDETQRLRSSARSIWEIQEKLGIA